MVRNKVRVLLRGAHDSFNFGDDIILIAISYFLKKDIKLDSDNLELYIQRNLYSLQKLNYKFDVELKSGVEITDIFLPANSKLKLFKIPKLVRIFFATCILVIFFLEICLFRVTRKTLLFKNIILFFKNLDVLHYIGGGYITDRWKHRMLYELLTVKIAKMINPSLKIVGTGLGFGPFKYSSSLFFLKSFVSKFDYLYVREQQSFNLIEKLNTGVYTKCLGDDALLLFPLFENVIYETSKSKEEIVAINLKDFPDHEYDKIVNNVENFLILLDKKKLRSEYFCFGEYPGPNDYDALQNLHLANRKVISTIHNPYNEGFTTFIKSLSKIKFGFGFAYHFIIMLAIMGIPAIGVYAGDYYKQKINGATDLFNAPPGFNINEVENQDFEITINQVLQNGHNRRGKVICLYENMIEEYGLMYKKLIGETGKDKSAQESN